MELFSSKVKVHQSGCLRRAFPQTECLPLPLSGQWRPFLLLSKCTHRRKEGGKDKSGLKLGSTPEIAPTQCIQRVPAEQTWPPFVRRENNWEIQLKARNVGLYFSVRGG
jgi:hypothetical protein